MTNNEIILHVIDEYESREFTNHAWDRGGPTKFGITIRFLSRYLGRTATITDIQHLTLPTAIDCYRTVLMERTRIGEIPDWRIRFCVYDFAVNFGEDDAVPALQRALGVAADGRIGPVTLAAAAACDPPTIVARIMAIRQRKHVSESYKPNQMTNFRGWIARCTDVLETTMAPTKGA